MSARAHVPDRPRHGHAPPLLAALRARAGLSLAEVGVRIGRTYSPVLRAESAPGGVSAELVRAIAVACGATREEYALLEALDALDRGMVPVPAGTPVEVVRQAIDVLRGTEAGGT